MENIQLKRFNTINISILSCLVLLCTIFMGSIRVSAATMPQFSSTQCGDQNMTPNTVLVKEPLEGNLYVRLPKVTPATKVNLYSEPLTGGGCTLIGTTIAQSGKWTIITGLVNLPAGTSLTLQGPGLGAEPYVAAADLLSANSICTPNITCDTAYGGKKSSGCPEVN